MKYSFIQSTEENQYVQVKMEEKQRELGTESRLSASNESGAKGEISIYSIYFVIKEQQSF